MTNEQKVIRAKVGVLELEQLGNVSQACAVTGQRRDSFQQAAEESGFQTTAWSENRVLQGMPVGSDTGAAPV